MQDYRNWLTAQGYPAKTISDRMAELARIEGKYGPVRTRLAQGRLADLIACLTYSTQDARDNRPNPSRFVIQGDLRSNLATYKSALRLYLRFLQAARPVKSP